MLRFCQGTYVRGDDGIWRYAWGDPVPGASDLTVADLLMIGESSAGPLTDAEHAWASGLKDLSDEVLVRPTNGRRPDARDLVVGMQAPELQMTLMLTVEQIAERAYVTKATIDSYRYRGYLPEPQGIVGRTPLWARPIIAHWLAHRPGPGWRSDIYRTELSEPAGRTAGEASTRRG
jgi:hypothetical protein